MATTAGEAIFVDTNVVVHARNADSPDHEAAVNRLSALEQAGAELWISRQVLSEFAVIVSKQMMARDAYDAELLAQEIDQLEREYLVADEDADVTRQWKELIKTQQVKGKPVHDANIVATMLAFGVRRLLTQNVADFRRYEPQIEIMPL
jgi:predicted nucleic acid-binding protein